METKSSLLGAAVESGTDTENAYGVHDIYAHDDDINGQLTKPQPVNNSSTVLFSELPHQRTTRSPFPDCLRTSHMAVFLRAITETEHSSSTSPKTAHHALLVY